jgi:predicted RND superfamily exporter protein
VGLPPHINPNIVDLLPPDQPQVAAVKQLAAEGGTDAIVLTFEGEDPDAMADILDRLTADLQRLDTVAFALHRLDPELAMHVGLMQLEPATVEELAVRLEMALRLGPALNPFLAAPVLDMSAVAEDIAAAADVRVLLPAEGRGRVLVKPTRSTTDPPFCEQVVADVLRVVAEADLAAAAVRHVYTTGPYVIVADGVQWTRQDLQRTSVVSAILVLLVLMVGMRSFRAPLLVLSPIVLANLVNLALIAVVVGSLNTYTSIGTALLIGLGIDFAVHLVGRTREERALGADLEDAIAVAWDRTGPPCITAGLTSAAGFAALGLARFDALAQLGFSLSVGLLLCLVSMLVLLPVLLPWLDPVERPLLGARVGGARGTGRPWGPWGLAAMVGALVLTVVVGAWGLPALTFEYDFTAISRNDMVYSGMDPERQALVREGFPPVAVTVADRGAVPAEHARLKGLVGAGALPHVAGVVSLENLLPADQAARLVPLTRLRALVDHRNLRYLPAPLVEDLRALRAWTPRLRTEADLPEGLLGLFGDGRRILLIPQGDLYDMRESAAMIDELDAVVEGAVSGQLLQGVVYRLIMADALRIALLALVLVTLLAGLHLRRPVLVVGAVGSLLVGLVWAGAAAVGVGIRINLVNMVALPILLGIGIDVVIHLTHRLVAEGAIGRAYRTVGVAALLSTVTTIASFLSLNVAVELGIRSLGQLVVVGLATVTVVSAGLLALGWATALGWRAPATGRDGSNRAPPPR